MIDNYLLKELVTFASEKTLAKTAEKLNVTQPTVTRGMQKLEDELEFNYLTANLTASSLLIPEN